MSEKALTIHPLEHLGGGEIRTAFCMGDPCRPGFELVRLPSWLTHEQRTEIGAEFAAAHQMREAIARQVANIERWMETGAPADADESRSIYEQLRAALAAATPKTSKGDPR